MAYLSYKKLAKPIVDSYFGNKKLIDSEKEREKELINNIGEAVKKQIIEQHQKANEKDKAIDSNADKKIEQVVKLVTSHILKGNDLKLLAIPEANDEEEKEDYVDNKEELRTISSQVRQAMKIIPPKEMKALLEKYNDPDE
jgi:Na+/phosphate symporter